MRIIDADALVKQLKEDAENLQGLAFQMATSHLIGVIENQPTVVDLAKQARIVELEKKVEAQDAYIEQMQSAREHDSGVIEALQFTVRCNGISPDVTLPFRLKGGQDERD